MDEKILSEYGKDALLRQEPTENDKLNVAYKAKHQGLTLELVNEISDVKGEPDWMRKKRIESFKIFEKKPIPKWGPDLGGLDFGSIVGFVRPKGKEGFAVAESWDSVPQSIKEVFERLGIPEAERKFLAGVSAQYDSEVLYKKLKKELDSLGVIFMDMDSAVQEYPEIVKKYFMTKCVPPSDNKFAALHGAFWSGGSFVYVPAGVSVPQPLQIYFMMNYPGFGQFEHTLIIAEEGSQVQYIEGCSAPHYTKNSLHSAVVEIFAKKGSRVRYTSIQNWSKNVYNLNTKRAIVEENAIMEWVSGTLGSGTTMLYPCSVLVGRGARAEHLSIALAGEKQVKDTGAKVIHLAEDTCSKVLSKSICRFGGVVRYRGLVHISKKARGAKCNVRCDSMMADDISKAETVPVMDIRTKHATVGHEAFVGRISEDQLFYLQSRGITQEEALAMIVRGFIEPIVKELPLEYAVELNRLIELEMEGSVG
ncbi:MAG: Fe-S cluster assembly protein SufB [Candidatus Micrarchaeota archaeon]|nr:Fe-S cluster assembly protein SufB [Candidatus Micrarchaeota archaeon]